MLNLFLVILTTLYELMAHAYIMSKIIVSWTFKGNINIWEILLEKLVVYLITPM